MSIYTTYSRKTRILDNYFFSGNDIVIITTVVTVVWKECNILPYTWCPITIINTLPVFHEDLRVEAELS